MPMLFSKAADSTHAKEQAKQLLYLLLRNNFKVDLPNSLINGTRTHMFFMANRMKVIKTVGIPF